MAILIGTLLLTLWNAGYPIFGHKHFPHLFAEWIMKECRRMKYVLPQHALPSIWQRCSYGMKDSLLLTKFIEWHGRADSGVRKTGIRSWTSACDDLGTASLLFLPLQTNPHMLYVRTCSRTSVFHSYVHICDMCTTICNINEQKHHTSIHKSEILRFWNWYPPEIDNRLPLKTAIEIMSFHDFSH